MADNHRRVAGGTQHGCKRIDRQVAERITGWARSASGCGRGHAPGCPVPGGRGTREEGAPRPAVAVGKSGEESCAKAQPRRTAWVVVATPVVSSAREARHRGWRVRCSVVNGLGGWACFRTCTPRHERIHRHNTRMLCSIHFTRSVSLPGEPPARRPAAPPPTWRPSSRRVCACRRRLGRRP